MNRRIQTLLLAFALSATAVSAADYTVAVYYWPNFHADKYHQSKKWPGWNEWEIVKNGTPQFEGHYQPKIPLWGYRDESDPKEMARSIDAMADNGIGAVIFDWYRYDDDINGGMMIEEALKKGFLQAPNRDRVKFALMWANHTYIDCHPFAPGKDFSTAEIWRKGEVGPEAFRRHTQDAIDNYFKQPNYWKIDGKPYFSIYDSRKLLPGLGGVAGTRAALADFRARVKAAGFPDLHLNIVDWGLPQVLATIKGQPFPGDATRKIETVSDVLAALTADSSTMYTWVHHVSPTPGQSDTMGAGSTKLNAFGFADDLINRASGPELVRNGDFAKGMEGWHAQDKLALEIVSESASGKAVKATQRASFYASPAQDIREALLKNGPGFYQLSLTAKCSGQNTDSVLAAICLEDDAGKKWVSTEPKNISPDRFETVAARRMVNWKGALKSAIIYFATAKDEARHGDIIVQRVSLTGPLAPAASAKTPGDVILENAAKANVVAVDYAEYGNRALRVIDSRPAALNVMYFPHVAVGWDGSPRHYKSGIVVNNTPERWHDFLRQTRDWLDRHPESRGIVTLNSWNEWVEGSYIEPDTIHGMKYLEAVRDVFKKTNPATTGKN